MEEEEGSGVITSAVITLSDKASRGEREDTSGPYISNFLTSLGWEVMDYSILPDDTDGIEKKLIELCERGVNVIITTGGTGVSPRDNTPEATLRVIEKRLHGIETAILLEGLKKTPRAAISRGIAGIRGNTVIINLPGSRKAVEDGLTVLRDVLPHLVDKMLGSQDDCGT